MSYPPARDQLPDFTSGTRFSLAEEREYSEPKRKRVQRLSKPQKNGHGTDYPIIVHCHLCWDWVWQRPQQFISRLSRKHKVLFVETIGPDPGLATPVARFRVAENFPNVTLLRLQFPLSRWNDGEYVDRQRRRIVQDFIARQMPGEFEQPVQWFYDPMAVQAFGGQMGEILTVYDCMDELSKFREAPANLLEREAELLARADVVFTGGRKLFESKRRFNDNCHFHGCGVEVEHFGKARAASTAVPEKVRGLGKPVLGYFGVLDERMDYELIAALADAEPDWSIVLVGPTLKVEAGKLPRRDNLHWLGQQPYADLPAFCKGFDVCLMPFALNEATEFINPTKALEYLATGRPVVSTPVPDVVANFGSVIQIGANPEEFITLCRQAAHEPDSKRISAGLRMAAENSWDSVVEQLEQHLREAMFKSSKLEVPA